VLPIKYIFCVAFVDFISVEALSLGIKRFKKSFYRLFIFQRIFKNAKII